jgi:hypothetical protein
MSASNASQGDKYLDREWHILGDLPLCTLLQVFDKDAQVADSILAQTLQEWGVPVECRQNIERMLENIIVPTLFQSPSGKADITGHIRLYIQRKSRGGEIKGGWGYFLIKRSRGPSSENWNDPLYSFYIYEEGD